MVNVSAKQGGQACRGRALHRTCAGQNIVVVDAGAGKSLTTNTLKSDVYAFLFGQQDLMAGIGLQGQRIVKFDE